MLGLFMLHVQRLARRNLSEQTLSDHERVFLVRRIRRRTQVSGMILIIGIMIPMGDAVIPWQKALVTFAIYWIIVLLLAMWTILLAFADIAATRMHTALELTKLQLKQQELERMAQQIRAAQQAKQDTAS